MYAGEYLAKHPDRPALVFVPADGGDHQVTTYDELEGRANQLAHLLRRRGLQRLDHYSIFMENHPRYLEACA
ncbi:MAG: AMP-binding protein, partial [Actinomycetota bacterium]